MGSLFEIAKSGIQAYRQALSVTGQNIANVNTEGYSKRDVALEEIGGIQGGVTDVSDQSGLGVRVDEIRRSFNAFINERLRTGHSTFEQINQFSKEVESLENNLLPEGSDLSTFIGKFFSSLQEIAAAPEDSAPRTVAMEAGKDMVNSFNDYSTRLKLSQEGAFSQSKLSIDKINLLSNELASVNNRLKSAGATKTANDLLDTRDLLLENLSKEIEFTAGYGDRGDVTLRLGNSGQGPILVSPSKAFNLRAKVTENSDFRYAFEQTVNNISIFIVEGTNETSTTQITGGKIAGLVNYYAYVQEVKSAIDDIAFRVARDFNNVQKNGKDLTGKIGNDMFLVGLPTVEKNVLKDSNLDVKVDQLEAVVNLKENIDLNFDGSKWKDNKNNTYAGNNFNINGLVVTLNGEAKKGDSFSITANNDLSSSLKFNLKSGNEFAASAFKLAESNTNNFGTGELTIEGSYKDPALDITSVEDIFTDTDNTLLATSFLKNGAIASIGKNIKEINLKSYSLQPQLSYIITDDQAKTINSFDLELANGNTVSLTFNSNDLGHKVNTVRDLADILNSGVDPGGNSFSFASYGLIASGANGALTIASNDQNFTSSSISTRSSGTLNGIVKNTTASELKATDINIFTREGKHIAGTPLKLEEYSALINSKNGFLSNAVYNAEYINQDYRDMHIERGSVESDYSLFTGHSASRSSNPVTAQTLSIDTFNDGIVDTTLTVPVSSSSSYTLKEFKENASKSGILAEAITRVMIDPIEDIAISGTISMSLSSGLKDAVSISATILPNDLSNLVNEINKVSELTGVKAILFSDKKRLILENSDAEDIKITNFSAPGAGQTTATVLNQLYRSTTSSITLGSASTNNSAVFTGTIKLQSAVDFALTSTDGGSNLVGSAAITGFDNGRGKFTWSDTGETLTIENINFGSADESIASNDGLYASKSIGAYNILLPEVDGSSSFSSTVYTNDLDTNSPYEVHKAMIDGFRKDSPDIRIVGNVINTLPADDTTLSLEFEGNTYKLKTLGKQVIVEGGEKDRINAFFTPVSGWSGGSATEISSEKSLVVSSGNTFTVSVDGTSSGTITLAATTYTSNSAVASALESAINADSTLSAASKSVSVKWTGEKYELVSNTGKQTYSITDNSVASVKITSIDSTIENDLKLSIANGASESINGYQLGIVGAGSISASQITFPENTQNTASKTSLGLDAAIANIEGKSVTNNPTNRDSFKINVKTGSWTGGTAGYLTSSSTITLSGTNTIQLKVDDVTSGTITVPNATYDSNVEFAWELEEAINNDSTLLAAGKSVSVLWYGQNEGYQIVSHNSTSSASVEVTSVSSALEAHTNLTTTNGGATSDSSQYTVKYTDAAWLGGTATTVTSSASLTIPGSGNTFQVTVDGIASGSLTLPSATYTSNVDIASALATAINGASGISGVEVKWTGSAYKIISTSTSSQNVLVTSVDSAIESNLKLTTANGGAENDYSFDLYDPTGYGSKRQIFLNDVNLEWNSTDKNLSISRKTDTSPLHEVSFVSDATNNEKFGIKYYPHNVVMDGSNIVITSGNGKPVNITFADTPDNNTTVGEFISLKNLPPEELIVVLNGSGTARRVSASYETQEVPSEEIGQNLLFNIDSTNEKLIHILDADTGHNIAERTLNSTGRFKVGGYSLKLSGTASVKDSFSITDNLGGVGDGRNITAMLDLQEDKFESEGKGNFQDLFAQIVASVGSSVQSSELNKNSSEMIRDAAANAVSELSGVNMDDEAAQLIEYQQAYQASARVLQTARELFDTLIDRI
ncbi:flagellar hook-associated protein FlgK [Alphaproteobacteria bacterium]|nr:flagellar hook-associated protein FlgK [Alphaproteobacteria bacterium]